MGTSVTGSHIGLLGPGTTHAGSLIHERLGCLLLVKRLDVMTGK